MPKILLLNPGVSDPDTHELLFLLFWEHLQLRTRSTSQEFLGAVALFAHQSDDRLDIPGYFVLKQLTRLSLEKRKKAETSRGCGLLQND